MIRQRIFIAAVLCGYAAWVLFFLIRGKVPRSIFKSATGLPCPTTGGWRSLLALCRGDWETSLLYNPFTVIFLLLLAASCFFVVRCLLRREPVLLPPWLAFCWFGSLALAWLAKFLIGPAYW